LEGGYSDIRIEDGGKTGRCLISECRSSADRAEEVFERRGACGALVTEDRPSAEGIVGVDDESAARRAGVDEERRAGIAVVDVRSHDEAPGTRVRRGRGAEKAQ
jgi:hypothetical protein